MIDLSSAIFCYPLHVVTYAEAATEVERELSFRRRTYPDRINSGRMKRADADYQLAIFAAIAADVLRMAHAGPSPMPAAAHTFTWAERRKALERELDYRDRFYPEWIAGGRLTQARADRQRFALQAILCRYDAGFDWIPDDPARRMDEIRQQFSYPTGSYFARWYPEHTEPAQAAML